MAASHTGKSAVRVAGARWRAERAATRGAGTPGSLLGVHRKTTAVTSVTSEKRRSPKCVEWFNCVAVVANVTLRTKMSMYCISSPSAS